MANYTTLQEDRVDKIAFRLYGDLTDEVIAQIVYRNGHLARSRQLPQGVAFSLPEDVDDLLNPDLSG